MIDTITIQTNDRLAKEAIRESISKEKLRETDINSFAGNIENMQIKGNCNGVFITGSIAKFLNKENVTPLNRESYKTGLHKLETIIGYDFLKDCIVRRVDIGYSFIVRNPVVDYLSLFGFYDNAKYERVQYGMIDTLTYKTNTGSFAFCAYDKIKECVKKNDNIPDLYNAMNVLRMEYRILKRQGIQHIFQQDIKPYDIAEKAIYRKLIGLFLGFYNGIQKNGRSIIVNTDKELTEKEFNDLIAEKYRQKYTADYECTKQSLIDKGLFSVPTLKRIRQKEKKNRNDFSFSDTNSLIQEIDEKTRLIELQGN